MVSPNPAHKLQSPRLHLYMAFTWKEQVRHLRYVRPARCKTGWKQNSNQNQQISQRISVSILETTASRTWCYETSSMTERGITSPTWRANECLDIGTWAFISQRSFAPLTKSIGSCTPWLRTSSLTHSAANRRMHCTHLRLHSKVFLTQERIEFHMYLMAGPLSIVGILCLLYEMTCRQSI